MPKGKENRKIRNRRKQSELKARQSDRRKRVEENSDQNRFDTGAQAPLPRSRFSGFITAMGALIASIGTVMATRTRVQGPYYIVVDYNANINSVVGYLNFADALQQINPAFTVNANTNTVAFTPLGVTSGFTSTLNSAGNIMVLGSNGQLTVNRTHVDFLNTQANQLLTSTIVSGQLQTVTTNNVFATTVSPTSSTLSPTSQPTRLPTLNPTRIPTFSPTSRPTRFPTLNPTTSRPTTRRPTTLSPITEEPTEAPNASPTEAPTAFPSWMPTSFPSIGSFAPTAAQIANATTTAVTTALRTLSPSQMPTAQQIANATTTAVTTALNTLAPTADPTGQPTSQPSWMPTAEDIANATTTAVTTALQTLSPTADPTGQPSWTPTSDPTKSPSNDDGAQGGGGSDNASTIIIAIIATAVVGAIAAGLVAYKRKKDRERVLLDQATPAVLNPAFEAGVPGIYDLANPDDPNEGMYAVATPGPVDYDLATVPGAIPEGDPEVETGTVKYSTATPDTPRAVYAMAGAAPDEVDDYTFPGAVPQGGFPQYAIAGAAGPAPVDYAVASPGQTERFDGFKNTQINELAQLEKLEKMWEASEKEAREARLDYEKELRVSNDYAPAAPMTTEELFQDKVKEWITSKKPGILTEVLEKERSEMISGFLATKGLADEEFAGEEFEGFDLHDAAAAAAADGDPVFLPPEYAEATDPHAPQYAPGEGFLDGGDTLKRKGSGRYGFGGGDAAEAAPDEGEYAEVAELANPDADAAPAAPQYETPVLARPVEEANPYLGPQQFTAPQRKDLRRVKIDDMSDSEKNEMADPSKLSKKPVRRLHRPGEPHTYESPTPVPEGVTYAAPPPPPGREEDPDLQPNDEYGNPEKILADQKKAEEEAKAKAAALKRFRKKQAAKQDGETVYATVANPDGVAGAAAATEEKFAGFDDATVTAVAHDAAASSDEDDELYGGHAVLDHGDEDMAPTPPPRTSPANPGAKHHKKGRGARE